jgi:hypothetical protein
MKTFLGKIGYILISAIAGGIVTIILLANGWIWSGLLDKLKYEIATLVVSQLDYTPKQSDERIQSVPFSCPTGSRIVTASCIEHDSAGKLQPAIAEFEKDGTLTCHRAGPDQNAKVQATAICARVNNTFK